MRSRALIIAALAASVPLAGCGGSSLTAPPDAGKVRADPAPKIDVKALTGNTRLTNASLGDRVVVLNFWASSCGPCRTEMPALSSFSRDHPEIRMVGIAVLDDPAAARDFARKVGVDYELFNDPGGDNFNRFGRFGFVGLPGTVVLDTKGRVARSISGALNERDLVNLTADVK